MNVGIVGLGLMGASFGRALRAKGVAKVFGADIAEDTLLKAELIGAIDDVLDEKSAAKLDMLVVSVYPRDFKKVAETYLPFMKKGSVVLDFCGIKRNVCKDMKELSASYPDINFIGGHPMAGREYSGIDHSVTTLFEKASMLLIPVRTDIFKEEELKAFFLSVGFGEVVFTTAETHDEIISYTSQLCHIVSNAFIKSPTAQEHHGYSAGSYRDLTRVARLHPGMWSQLMMDNKDKLKTELDLLISNLQKYSDALGADDEKKLCELLAEGNDLKLKIDARRSK
ncbi:MAG: prephenate dehydrogenase [Clostridia bacterium]|nr:prephenate dehydrogenase [Clostridia bacterium]